MINDPFNYNLGEFFLTISCVLIQVWLAVSKMSFDISYNNLSVPLISRNAEQLKAYNLSKFQVLGKSQHSVGYIVVSSF